MAALTRLLPCLRVRPQAIGRLALPVLLAGLGGCASLPPPTPKPYEGAYAAPERTDLGRLALQMHAKAAARSASGFELLADMGAALSSRLALAQAAQKSLDLQYYAIHADASTGVLLDAVRDAARRGVRVRILLDDFNTVGRDAQVLRLAFEPGIEVRLFNPLPGSRGSLVERVLASLPDVDRLQRRMHNKLFIADSAWGITGGRNLGDAYFGTGDGGHFVDLDVLAAGPIVRDMAASFDHYWNDALAYPVQRLLSPDDIERLARRSEASPASPQDAPGPREPPGAKTPTTPEAASSQPVDPPPFDLSLAPLVWAPAVLLADKPSKIDAGADEPQAADSVVDGLLSLMRQAQREVLIVTPYFVPGRRMMETFAQLRVRGIPVRVLTNSLASTDAPAAHAGYARHRPELLRLGLQLFEMRADPSTAPIRSLRGSATGSLQGSRASLHSKAVVIDGRLTVIGSMNLDLRSQRQNSEVALLIRSAPFARQAARIIEESLSQDAYRVVLDKQGRLLWRSPTARFADAHHEPEAGLGLRLLVHLLGPFAPEEML